LDRVLKEALSEQSWTRVRALVEQGRVFVDGVLCCDIARPVGPTCVLRVETRGKKLGTDRMASVDLVYWDAQVVVVNKPSGISTVPFEPTEKDTLDELTRRALSKLVGQRCPPLGIVHRIDKETSGLVVFARTTVAMRHLKQQFRFHTNHRAYLALAAGNVSSGRIESRLVPDRGDGRRGSTTHPELGQLAVTHVEALERFEGATLIRCRLETGRTHQIRIHLGEQGHPLLGERVYGPRGQAVAGVAPRLMLHAAELGIVHPTRNEPMSFRVEPPVDFQQVLDRLRGK
jgi:23S rRNA pseudouridine1911/1915/1917 synthase